MFGIFKSVTKAALGVVFSPVSLAADVITCGGMLTDRDEPYTVTSMRNVLKNLDNAVDPDELTDEQVRQIIREVERQRK